MAGLQFPTTQTNTNPFGYKQTVDFTPKATAPAPGREPVASGMTTNGGYVASSGGPNYGGGGGGGGGSYNFDFSNNAQSPAMAAMPQPDWSGLFSGMGSLMDQDQKNGIPDTLPVSTQKDTMQLQGLRESAAGWQDLNGQGGPNPSLGNRIFPDESKKLAALQTARIY